MILHKLDSGSKVSLVELIWDIPANGPKLSAFLDSCVEECHTIQHGLPLIHVGDVQLILRDKAVCPLKARLDTLWGLSCELDGRLEEVDGELGVWLSGDPAAEAMVDGLSGGDDIQKLIHVLQPQVAVLEQHPVTLLHGLGHQAPGMHLLTLTHGDGTAA